MALKSRVGNLSLPVVFGAGAAGGLPGLAVAAGTQVIRFLLGSGRGRVPARAAEEASNQIRSSTAPKVWVVGRARVGTALVGHYDLVDPVVAAAYFEQADVTDVLGREQPDQVLLRRQRADRRMSLWSYYIWCIAEGSVEAVEDLWINGVLLNAAHTSGPSASDVGELAVPVNPLADAEWSPHEPFWVPQFLPKTKGPVVIEGAGQAVYDSDDPGDAPAYWVPSCAFWVSRGDEPAHLDPTDTNGALALRKVREVVNASNSTDAEKADIAASEGLTPTWVLGRFLNTWATRADRPWRGVPEVEALVRGRGPWFDFGEGAGPEPLLDGNIAKWAFWVLRYRLGVPLAHIDLPTLRHSVLDCQASEVVLAVTDTPTPASLAEARAFVSDIEAGAGQGSGAARQRFDTLAPDEQRRGEALLARLMQWLDEVGERPGATKLTPWYVGLSLDAKARLYHRWRVKVVVEQATGRPWGETTGTARARILAQWRKRFTGTADDSDGVRRRYWGGGVVPADSDWRAVLAELARSMAGSIEEHGGTWYIRSGTSTFRPSATITDADLRGGLPNQVLEPSLAEQPTEVRAAIAQDETAEFERHVLAPIRRDDANLGDVLADSQPAVVKVAELGFTLQEWAALTPGERVQAEASRRRVLDMGVLAYVTNPHQAAQLQRIALYQTRASTRTISLVVGFGKDFQFLKLGKGFPVSVSLDHAGVHGDVVGERRPALRCVVVEPPEVDWDAETVQLTLRQQDADAFGERHGLVFDYQDSPDVLLVGGVYTPTEDLSCSFSDWSAEPGASISRSDRWQVNVSGAVGAVQVSLNHQPGDPVFLAVDSDTGIVTGVLPAGRQGAFYVVHAVVRDEAGRVATCSARLHVGVVPAPEVRFDPPRPQAQRGASGSCRAYVHCSDDVGRIWDDACAGRWTFSLVKGPSWMSMSGDVLTWNVPADQPTGYVSARVRATASDGRSVEGAVALLVYVEGVFEVVCRRPVRVTLGVPVSVALVERMSGHEGSVSATYPSQVGGGFRIPPGLALSADNKRLTGTIPDTPANRSRLLGS